MKKLFEHILDYISGNEDKDFISTKHNELRDTLEYAAENFINMMHLDGVSKERLTDEWYESVLQRRKNQENLNKEYERLNKIDSMNKQKNYKNSFSYLMENMNPRRNFNINLDQLLISNEEWTNNARLIDFNINFKECDTEY